MSLRDAWQDRADEWARFARAPGRDRYFDRNLSRFLQPLPAPPARTLDLGCGEGRVGAELTARGYDVLGVDASPRLVELACERDGIEMTFHDRQVPLERYSRALEATGLLVEGMREAASERGSVPVFLHLRAVKAGA